MPRFEMHAFVGLDAENLEQAQERFARIDMSLDAGIMEAVEPNIGLSVSLDDGTPEEIDE